MYEMNGVTLSGAEYGLLKKIVECYDENGDPSFLADIRFDGSYADGRIDESFFKLQGEELIEGNLTVNGIKLERITQAGLDFVHDIEQKKLDEAKRTKQQRRHDYRVALIGGIAGLFSGALSGAFVPDLVCSLIALFSS